MTAFGYMAELARGDSPWFTPQLMGLPVQVDALMSAWSVQNVSIQLQDFFEDQVKLFRISHDYSLWH